MKWEWDSGGDTRVADLWRLREELSRSGKVVYAKWYGGRATFFSKRIYSELLRRLNFAPPYARPLGRDADQILQVLNENSPLSTKALKQAVGLQGKLLESTYQKATKQLWDRLMIVGFGEVDDGAFPSLAMGASQLLFEDLYREASTRPAPASSELENVFKRDPLILRFYQRLYRSTRDPASL